MNRAVIKQKRKKSSYCEHSYIPSQALLQELLFLDFYSLTWFIKSRWFMTHKNRSIYLIQFGYMKVYNWNLKHIKNWGTQVSRYKSLIKNLQLQIHSFWIYANLHSPPILRIQYSEQLVIIWINPTDMGVACQELQISLPILIIFFTRTFVTYLLKSRYNMS